MEGGSRKVKGSYSDDGALARVEQAQRLVLAGGEDLCAIPVPADAVDEVSVLGVHPHHGLPAGHVPQDHHVITAWVGSRRDVGSEVVGKGKGWREDKMELR